MGRLQSNLDFRCMAFTYKFRDLLLPRRKLLEEVGIRPGSTVLDYGCGPRSYIPTTAELVGETGRVYALDIHPLTIEMGKNIASKKRLPNVETILSDCETGLADESVDVVLLYDTLHVLEDPNGVLRELRRVLKPDGILSFSDHHMKEDEILAKVTGAGLFKLLNKGKRTYRFMKRE
ncbi:class I SAM-dependent methyltransferase [Chloroflexota bacterium]